MHDATLLTTDQVREWLQISKGTVYRLSRRWRWDRIKLGKSTRWRRTDILRAIEASARQMR